MVIATVVVILTERSRRRGRVRIFTGAENCMCFSEKQRKTQQRLNGNAHNVIARRIRYNIKIFFPGSDIILYAARTGGYML